MTEYQEQKMVEEIDRLAKEAGEKLHDEGQRLSVQMAYYKSPQELSDFTKVIEKGATVSMTDLEQSQRMTMTALEKASRECNTPMFCVVLECRCGDSISAAGYTLEAARGFIGQLGLAKGWDVEDGKTVCLGCRE